MVDAGNSVVVIAFTDFFEHTDMVEQISCTGLHAVAKTNSFDARVACHIAGENCHRVSIVKEPGVRANLLHISCKVFKDGDCTQTAHNSADAQSVCNRLTKTVFFGDFKVCNCAGVVKADLNCVNNKFCSAKGFLAVLNAEVGCYFCS